jgi:radical SAM protein with 4Fe4S-binding SPASM domain
MNIKGVSALLGFESPCITFLKLKKDRRRSGAACGTQLRQLVEQMHTNGDLNSDGVEYQTHKAIYERREVGMLDIAADRLDVARLRRMYDYFRGHFALAKNLQVVLMYEGNGRSIFDRDRLRDVLSECRKRSCAVRLDVVAGALPLVADVVKKLPNVAISLRMIGRDDRDPVCEIARNKGYARQITGLTLPREWVDERLLREISSAARHWWIRSCPYHCLPADERRKNIESGVLFSTLRSRVKEYLEHGVKTIFHCPSGTSSFYVADNGDVRPCRMFRKGAIFGNVDAGHWNETVWMRYMHAWISEKPLCGDCWAKYLCGGGCALEALRQNRSLYRPNARLCPVIRHISDVAVKEFILCTEAS